MFRFLKQLVSYFKVQKNYWLIPFLLIVVLLSGLVIYAETSVLAPFLYTLF